MTFYHWPISFLLWSFSCFSISNIAFAQPVSPAVTWQIISCDGSNPTFLRSVAVESVQENGSDLSYLMKLEMVYPSGSVTTLERGALANCQKKERFEIVNQGEWDSRPFSAVFSDTANAKELSFVCDLPLSVNPRFAVNHFPIPPASTFQKVDLAEAK